jgi:hypothetical protein
MWMEKVMQRSKYIKMKIKKNTTILKGDQPNTTKPQNQLRQVHRQFKYKKVL